MPINNEQIKWVPGDNIIIEIKDKTADKRGDEDISNMINELTHILHEYGFGLDSYGESRRYGMSITRDNLKQWVESQFEGFDPNA